MIPGKRQARSFPTVLVIAALMALPLATPVMAAPASVNQAPAEANWWTAVLDQFLGFFSPQVAESSSLTTRRALEENSTTAVAVPIAPEPEDPPRGGGGEGGEGQQNCCPGGGGGETGPGQDPNGSS